MTTVDFTLPPHVHAEVLTDRDVTIDATLRYVVVWADRIRDTCRNCGVDINPTPSCPATINSGAGIGGELESWEQQCSCGEINPVYWEHVADTDQVEAVARGVAEDRQARIDRANTTIRQRLLADVAYYRDHRDEIASHDDRITIEDGIVCGSDYRVDRHWHPDDTIDVTEHDL